LEHIGEGRAGSGKHLLHVLENAAGLRHDVVAADEFKILVYRNNSRDEQQVPEPYRIGIVADGGRQARDGYFLALRPGTAPFRHCPPPEVILKFVSTRFLLSPTRNAGVPAASLIFYNSQTRPYSRHDRARALARAAAEQREIGEVVMVSKGGQGGVLFTELK